MSCLEKKHVTQKARMQHPFNLDSFMDETDREVMNLTDRAFKSLCIGDEAIYNDSELLLSPVDCHKPLLDEIPKKCRENMDFRKQKAYQPNGVYNTPWQTKNTSKVSSLLAAFAVKKTNVSKMTNGDSWDKSALLSIQTELSEFSSDHHKPPEKGKKKSMKDIHNSLRKPSKNQHSKSTKLRKLNSINFFLHSEFSPFQSWEDLNRFELDSMELFPCSGPAGFYNSPIYRKLNNSNRLHTPELNKRETSQCTSSLVPLHKSKPDLSQCTEQNFNSVPRIQENHSEQNFLQPPDIQIETLQPQMLLASSGSFQRCQSEGDICAPWRKSRSSSKGVAQSLSAQPICESSNTGEQKKKEVKVVEEGTCLNSTPFNISQLLTPVIPSRQETGTSEILQSVQSPTALNIPALYETEIYPSPDFKREEYKSKASSLLFNLKDNRKRVKATYSPPKFKGLDVGDQAKMSPLIEQDITQNAPVTLEIEDSKNTLTVQKTSMYPISPETTDLQSSPFSGHINSTLPDDFLGLSLLLAENKGSKKPSAKAKYPSLNMYPKPSSEELNTKTMSVEVPVSHPTVNKSLEQKRSKDHLPEKKSKDLQRKQNSMKPKINDANHEYTHQDHVDTADKVATEKTNAVVLKEKYLGLNKHNAQQDAGSREHDKINTGGSMTTEERLIELNKCHKKETQPKHLFSARQNNYIKNQRCVNIGNDNDDECEYWQEDVFSAGRDEPRKNELNVGVHKDNGKAQESMDYIVTNDASTMRNYSHSLQKDLGICAEQEVPKNDTLSMKGNTSAKIALFTSKKKPSNPVPGSPKKNIVKDTYELATVALERMIAEREHRKKQSERQPGQDLSLNRKQESMLTSGQKDASEKVIPGRQEEKAILDSTATSQKLQSMSYIATNHSDCHLNELQLDEPCKQEGTAKHSPSRLISTDRNGNDRHGQQDDTSNNNSMAHVTKLKETVHIAKNIGIGQGQSEAQEYFDNKLISEDDSDGSIQKRRDRAHSLNDDRSMNKRQQKKDVGVVEGSVKHEMFHKVRKSNIPKDKVHVSPLMEKVNLEQVVPSLKVKECLSQEKNPMVYPGNDSLNERTISSNNIMGFSEGEEILRNENARDAASYKELPKKDFKSNERNEENLHNINKCVTINEEDKEDVTRSPDNIPMDRIPISDILNQVEPSLSVSGKQLEQGNLPSRPSGNSFFTPATDESTTLYIVEEKKYETLDLNHSYSNYNPESKLQNTDLAGHPPKDVEKGEWVRCLIESARSLSPTCQSNVSSPTLGKPALFKVKDNTFRASPVTKTVRPILHKSVAGVTEPWSPRESLSGSERGEEDPDLFKDAVNVQSPPLRISQPNQSSVQVVHPLSSQSITYLGRKGLSDSSTVPEDEEWQMVTCSGSDGIASFDISARDTVEELKFNTVPPDSIQESKAPSERSDSACSGSENQLQGKPPVVPPKTEKALRRAMKLTTKRIQKAEAKSKSDRGRSSEKGPCHKRERRHHSSDKALSDRSYQREHSVDRGSNNQSTEEDSSETSLPKGHTSKRHARSNNHRKVEDSRGKQQSSRSRLISMDEDAQSSGTEKQTKTQSPHEDQFDSQKINVDCERSGRTSEKYQPQKLYRRAQSLDRFLGGKYEHCIPSSKDPASKNNTETLKTLPTAQTAPLRQNSIEHAYGSSANNMVSQSFPMTQRKLLQDLDSGQYFVVDMPVQVKTKTFFDPETGSYVHLPVQSLEGSVPRAQSVEVVNAPPLMLYHGYVPVPVSSLP